MVTVDLPNNHGTVTGRFLIAKSDGNDIDSDLDWSAAGGTVLFTPDVPYIVNVSLDSTFIPATVSCQLDSDGYILGDDLQRGVKLLATDIATNNPTNWTWRVDFRITDETGTQIKQIEPYSFQLPAGSVVDLASVMPLQDSSGTIYIKGDTGETGPKGDTGAQGPQGPQGNSYGDSAYVVATQNGFIGTEAEWLDSLVGPGYTEATVNGSGYLTMRDTSDGQVKSIGYVRGSQGATGPRGIAGPDAQISIGSVTQASYGNPEVTVSYVTIDEVTGQRANYLNFSLPAGEQGPQGIPGAPGIQVITMNVDQSGNLIYGLQDPYTSEVSYSNAGGVVGPKGDKGDRGYPGIDGTNGVDGADGQQGIQGVQGKSAFEIAVQYSQNWYRDYNPNGAFTDNNGNPYDVVYAQTEQEFAENVARGTNGADGIGVPVGGSTNQVLAKQTSGDYDFHWATIATYDSVAADIDSAIQTKIADGEVSSPGVGSTPFKMKAGTQNVSGGVAERILTGIRFSSDLAFAFNTAPIVTATTNIKNVLASISAVTTQTMTITVKTIDASTIPSGTTVVVNWMAVQMQSNSSQSN